MRQKQNSMHLELRIRCICCFLSFSLFNNKFLNLAPSANSTFTTSGETDSKLSRNRGCERCLKSLTVILLFLEILDFFKFICVALWGKRKEKCCMWISWDLEQSGLKRLLAYDLFARRAIGDQLISWLQGTSKRPSLCFPRSHFLWLLHCYSELLQSFHCTSNLTFLLFSFLTLEYFFFRKNYKKKTTKSSLLKFP